MAPIAETVVPDQITAWIETKGGDQAVLLITVDGYLRPHVMMLARDELTVVAGSRLRVAVNATSRSEENLRLRSSATLAIYDADLACVIKTRAVSGPRPLVPKTIAYDLEVEDIRFDVPTAAEGAARLATGLRFEGRAERADIREGLRSLKR